MKNFVAALVAVLVLGSSAFAGGHCVQQVQRVVVDHHAQQVVQFVEVPELVIVRQRQVHAPVRVVERVEVQRVQKVQKVVVDNHHVQQQRANIKVEVNQGRRFLRR